MIIIKYQEQFYTSKFDSLDKMGKFLEAQNLPRLNYEEINNLNRLITIQEIESINKHLLEKEEKALNKMALHG